MDRAALKKFIEHAVPWVESSGLSIDLLEERHVKLSVPVRERHMNHVGIVWAGTHFLVMEFAGAALFGATYDVTRFVPVNRGMTIRFLRPAVTDLSCELSLTREEADGMIKPILEKGKGDWTIEIPVTDAGGAEVSRCSCNFYVIPTPAGIFSK
jgi:acyl-coenzyme A thioesterase PaaI-like protein